MGKRFVFVTLPRIGAADHKGSRAAARLRRQALRKTPRMALQLAPKGGRK